MSRTTDSPKLVRVTFRLADREREALAIVRRQLGLSKSEAARKALLIAAERLAAPEPKKVA